MDKRGFQPEPYLEPIERLGDMLEKFNEASCRVLTRSRQLAVREGHLFHSGHLLVTLFEEGVMGPVADHYDIREETLRAEVAKYGMGDALDMAEATAISSRHQLETIHAALRVMGVLEEEQVTPQHLFLGVLTSVGSTGYRILEDRKVDMVLVRCLMIAKAEGYEGGMDEFLAQLLGYYRWIYPIERQLMKRSSP